MSELGDIYSALVEGKRAAESLMTWQRGCDGRDSVRSTQWTIERGLRAYETLSRDLRDGRKHIDAPDDEPQGPRAANLDKADEGYELCPNCEGAGTHMVARMYPSGHTECTEECPECDGEGQIEIEAAASPATKTATEG